MYTHFFSKKINVENVNNLIELLDGKGEVELWFSTHGGETTAMKVLISYFNNFKGTLKLVITDQLQSAGTMLLTDYKGLLELRNLDFILFHLSDRLRYPLRKGLGKFDDILQQQDFEDNLEAAKKLKDLGLTEKELKRFLLGEDVIYYQKDFFKLKIKRIHTTVAVERSIDHRKLQPYQQLIGSKDEKIY